MPKPPKKKTGEEDEGAEKKDRSTWSDDQLERGYYYDDAHGYETYEPDEDEKEDAD